ncbi:hypothetical protein [Dongia sp.]|uniref:hypothetical protein n=1 Tax=Dongia sp. TaxID=1977262 RepID=UPI0037512702
MLFRTLLAGLAVLASAFLGLQGAVAQTQNDSFMAAKALSPDGLKAFSDSTRFFATLTSHNGKYVLNNATRVKASKIDSVNGVNTRVDDGILTIPPIRWGNYKTYELDFVASQTPSAFNRIYLEQLDTTLPECRPCFIIHRTIEDASTVTNDKDWVLGTVAATDQDGTAWQGIYLGGKEDGSGRKYLPVGTPIWQRQSAGDIAGIGLAFSDFYPRLVLRPANPSDPTSTAWQIAELKGNAWTGKLLYVSGDPNELFGLVQVVRSPDWTRYGLWDASNASPTYANFEIRRPLGIVASVPVVRSGKDFIDAPLYNIDATVTVKSASTFAGMAGLSFNMNAAPLTQLDQRFTYPGFIAFVPQVPERLAMTLPNGSVLKFPLDYNGSFPGLVFGIRGAAPGSCTERGMLDYPVTGGISDFLANPDDKIGSWVVCSLPWAWELNKPYKLRLWITNNGAWGAWVSDADGSNGRQIGLLTIPQDQFGNKQPRIASAAAFVSVRSPQACDKVAPLEITVEKLVGDANQAQLAFGTPGKKDCPGLKTATSCSGGSCTLGVQ